MGHKDTIKETLSHLGKAYVGVEINTFQGADEVMLWQCSIGNETDDVGVVSFYNKDLEEAVRYAVVKYISLVEQMKQIDW